MMRPAALLPILLAACAAKAAPAPVAPTENPAPPSALPAHYAALFEPGRAWTYRIEITHSSPEDGSDTETASVRCRVADTGTFAGGAWSRIDCDEAFGQQQPVAGVWAADGRGLFQLDAVPGNANELDPEYMRIPAAPAEATEELVDDYGDGPQRIGERSVTRQGEAWCKTVTSEVGDASWDEQCFGASGITAGNVGWSGGSDHETKYILVK